MATDKFPNIFIALLAQSLAQGGSETEVFLSTIKTLDGQTVQTSNFAYLGRAVLSVDVQSASRIEFVSSTSVSSVDTSFTGCTRGLSFNSNSVIASNKKFHPVGTPVIIAFGTHNLIDIETIIQTNYSTIEAQIAALIAALPTEYLAINGSNSPTANIPFATFRITNLGNAVNPQDAATLAQVNAATGTGPASTTSGGIVKIATDAEFAAAQNTTAIAPFTYYNMATLSQLNGALFTYGESITALDYVYQSDGTDQILISPASLAGAINLTSNSNYYGVSVPVDSRMQTFNSIIFNLQKSAGTFSGNVVAKIYASSGGLPTGSVLYTSTTIAASSISTVSSTPYTFTFTSASVNPSTTYAIVLDMSGVTYAGGGAMQVGSTGTNTHTFQTTNSGSTYTTSGVTNDVFYSISASTVTGNVYKVNLSGTTYNLGPYKGFALVTAAAGTSNNVKISGIAGGFSSLVIGGNVYINPSVSGGITQTAGITNGRCIGIAISATQIQVSNPKKRGLAESYTSGNVLNQDGFLILSISNPMTSTSITETVSAIGYSQVIYTVLAQLTSGGGPSSFLSSIPVCVPVRAGCSYNATGTFYPTVNG